MAVTAGGAKPCLSGRYGLLNETTVYGIGAVKVVAGLVYVQDAPAVCPVDIALDSGQLGGQSSGCFGLRLGGGREEGGGYLLQSLWGQRLTADKAGWQVAAPRRRQENREEQEQADGTAEPPDCVMIMRSAVHVDTPFPYSLPLYDNLIIS